MDTGIPTSGHKVKACGSGLAAHIQQISISLGEMYTRWFEENDSEELYRHPIHAWRLHKILDFTKHIHGRFLDIGCFTGVVSELIMSQGGKEVIGIDCLEKALELAEAKGIQTQQVDVNDAAIEFPDNHFDGVLAGEVLDYVYDPDAVLEEIRRLLKPGGTLIITVPNLVSLGNRILSLLGRPPYQLQVRPRHGGYWRYFTFDTMRRLLHDHQFGIETMESSVFVCPLIRFSFNRWPCRCIPWLSQRLAPKREWKRHRIFFSKTLARLFPRLGENIIVRADCVK